MTLLRNRLLNIIAVLLLGGFITGNALAASDAVKEGGIGGTGSAANSKGIGGTGTPAMNGGIGGTGAPAMNSGIGGTGLRPDSESAMLTPAGKVLFVVGQVEAQNLGQIRPLTKGDLVRVGDTLKSSKGASLQLLMDDGGTIVLRPESQLVIESFVYKGVQDGSEHMALALLSGGFRAVTGDIGHLHKENYSIRTPNATVGILGTDHETVFVSATQPGQTAAVEPGTYNHVISGATVLQSEKGKLLIKPNQTGFAPLNGATPIMLDKTLQIFGNLKANPEERGEQLGDMNNASQDRKGNSSSSDSNSGAGQNWNGSISGAEQNSRGGNNAGSGAEQNSGNPIPDTGQNKIIQPDLLGNTNLDLNTLETDVSPAPSGSAVVGAQMADGLLVVGSVQAGNTGETLLVERSVPGSYTNNNTGFNFIANEGSPINKESAYVDDVKVTWGIYNGGIAFDRSGNAFEINFQPFAYVSGGATPPSVVSAIGGTATFSTMVEYTKPVTESGTLGGNVTLNVGINLSTATLTSYNLGVTDANSRNWIGTLSAPVPLSTFMNGTPLAVTCGACTGTASGSAAGLLIGQNAKGLISSYALRTTTGQAVVGAAIMSRP